VEFGTRLGSAGQDRSTWLVLLFLTVAVLAPTACVLWFMNEAAKNQADAARQRVTEAYRGQLRFLREGIDSFWQHRSAELAAAPAGGPVDFQKTIASGLADSWCISIRMDRWPILYR
jgi:hypothetical protein